MADDQTLPPSQVIAVVPARYHSQRFPGKLLADIDGQPVIERVVRAARAASRVGTVLVATDHAEILAAAEAAGATVTMTRPDHVSGTDRIGEAVEGRPEAVVLNIQGDEPGIDPAHIDELVRLLEEHPQAGVSTLATPLVGDQLHDPNVVKVVRAADGRALYFSRAAVPAVHPDGDPGRAQAAPPLRHLGVYGYRAAALALFLATPLSPLERREGLEQLRLMEAGVVYQVGLVAHSAPGVDTPQDLERVRAWLRAGGSGASGPQRVG